MVFGILITRILSGQFSVYEYGTYSQIILLSTTITNFTIMGMTDGINYFFCHQSDEKKREKYVSTIFFLQVVLSAVAAVIVLFCAVPISRYFGNPEAKKLIFFVAILPILQNLISLLQILFFAVGKAKQIAYRNFAVHFFKLVVIVIAGYVFHSIVFILIFQVLMDVVQIAYFYVSLRKNNCTIHLFRFDLSLVGEILKYCIPMAMFLVIKSLNRDCDKYVIAAFTNTETLAVYTNAAKQLPFDLIMTSFCTVLFPHITRFLAQKKYEIAQSVYRAFFELSYLTTAALAIGAVCVAPELLEFLYTAKYSEGLPIFAVYLFVDVLSIFNLTMILSAAGKTKTILYVSIGAFVSNLVLNLLLYSVFGIIGPAIATLAVTFGQGIFLLSFSAKEMKTKIWHLLDWKKLVLFAFSLAGVAVIVLALRRLLVSVSVPSVIRMGLCYLAFVLPLAALYLGRIKKCITVINSCKKSAQ